MTLSVETSTGVVRRGAQPSGLLWSLRQAVVFAMRDFRSGFRGFGVFIACVAIGVAAITAVAVVSRGLTDGIAREGRVILGADAAFVTIQREASEAERAYLSAQGKLGVVAYMRGMARAGEGASLLAEIKAVDGNWPLHGRVVTTVETPVSQLLSRDPSGIYGAVADPLLFVRLNLKVGDEITVGTERFRLRAELVTEPDKLAGGVGFGPRLLISEAGLRDSGLIQPGSLMRWSYRVTLPGEPGEQAIQAVIDGANRAFPEAGWETRSRLNASPQFARQIDRFTQFLTLVGLTALMVGGVGVANASKGFVDRRRADIAVLKSLGATGGFAFILILIEIMALAFVGSVIGLVVGALIPLGLTTAFGHLLPLPLASGIYPTELLLGLSYGMLTALSFSVIPLGKAHDVPVSALFRNLIDPSGAWPRTRYLILGAVAIAALIALAVTFAWDRRIAIMYIGFAAAAFALLRGVGLLVMAGARRLPRPKSTEARLALGNIHRPGALTPAVTLSLGLGLTLLVAIGLVDSNLRKQLVSTLPERAPSFFFIDIPNAQTEAFDALLRRAGGDVTLERVPMMRGRIVAVKGIRSEDYKAAENATWALEGDRGITYSAALPAASRLVEGEWWPADYRGKPLVSVTENIARGLNLRLGDTLTVNVLGRNITAEIASIRRVEWRTVGINFIMVFSPNTFAGAPHTHLATLTFNDKASEAERETAVTRAVASAFPAVSSVRVKDALNAASELVSQLTLAMRGASSIALIASIVVLAGALAAGREARIKDAVILKTVGATRRQLFLAFLMEYALLGVVTAIFGLLAGAAAAYAIVTQVMNFSFAMDWSVTLLSVSVGLVLMIALGLAGTWRILGYKPASYLREL